MISRIPQYLCALFIVSHLLQVVKDVVLTINQAIEPVEKGVMKIQETFRQKTGDGEEEMEATECVCETRQHGK